MEVRVLRDHQVVLKDSLDEILTVKQVFKLLEVNWILGRLGFEGVDECLQLMMRVNTTLLDVIKELMLKKVSSVLRVKGLEGTACPWYGQLTLLLTIL
jgi:hypothetical protein